MADIEKLNIREIPKMLDNMVVCVDSKVWNKIVDYVNSQTEAINKLIEFITKMYNTSVDHSKAIQDLANILKEHIEL